MMIGILLIFISFAQADPSWKWANAIKIVEKHEFYTNNEVITRPQNSWQVLFAVMYNDSNLKTLKDCLFYKVPGDELGVLKLKTMPAEKPCEEALYTPGDLEWKDLKALQFSLQDRLLSVSLTNLQFQIEKWDVPLFNVFEHPKPKPLMSSAEYRSPKMIYLTPYKGIEVIRPEKSAGLANKTTCHDVQEDCSQKSPSICSQCAEGWYEVSNGCASGPKYCGKLACGSKDQPACRRGIKYQRVEKLYDCQEDASFAYCSKGFTVTCQANLAYCL